METVFIMLAAGAMCAICFVLGAKVGQAASKGDGIKVPTINPLKAVQENRNRKAAEEEQSRIDTIMRNIESYDGTGNKQEDVPGR